MGIVTLSALPFRTVVRSGVTTYECDLGNIKIVATDTTLLDGGPIRKLSLSSRVATSYNNSIKLPANVKLTPVSGVRNSYSMSADSLSVMMISYQQAPNPGSTGVIVSALADTDVSVSSGYIFEFTQPLVSQASVLGGPNRLQGVITVDTFVGAIPASFSDTIVSTITDQYGATIVEADHLDYPTAEQPVAEISFVSDILTNNAEIQLESFASDAVLGVNKIVAAIYGGTGSDIFYGVAADSSNNIICVGSSSSEGTATDALVVKFDPSLNILARKRYGGAGSDYFQGVAVDSSNNVVCVGYTASEGAGGNDALVVKFDTNLNILARKRYGGTGADAFYAVVVDSVGNIVCVGHTTSEGTADDALVVKFDTNLNILSRKRYGGTGADYFKKVAIDSANNIICAGITGSEGSGSNDALVVKFDTNLNILARKRYGGTGSDIFYGVAADSSNNIICAGSTASEGTATDALVVKFDPSLNILARKRYGGAGGDYLRGVVTDSAGNIICAGSITSSGGGSDTAVIRLPVLTPSGTFTGAVLTTLTMADSNLTLTDSTLTLANSALTLANSALTLADSALTLANSSLTLTKDTINP